MKNYTHLSIRMNPDIHKKIIYIAEYNGRSMSRQISYLIQKCIHEFDKENGEISLEIHEK